MKFKVVKYFGATFCYNSNFSLENVNTCKTIFESFVLKPPKGGFPKLEYLSLRMQHYKAFVVGG